MKHVVLIGPMASGKSSIGRHLAALLGREFIDTDSMIVAKHGPITQIFDQLGESTFRQLEESAVAEAIRETKPAVISLGGGAIISPRNRALLENQTVILLMTDLETVLSRANLEKRPLLRDDPEAWNRILEERMPLYQAAADVTFDTGKLPRELLAQRIADWLRR